MHCKLVVIVVTGFLPFITLGDATNSMSSVSSPPTINSTTNQEPRTLRLKVTCRSGAVVTLDNATLVEQGVRKAGYIPPVRLNLLDGGTVSISWNDIEKIAVGDKVPLENTNPIEVTLKNVKETKVGKTSGEDNTIFGQSDAGEFSIQLKDVTEIVVLPSPKEK
jgi:hypothetical protein